MTSQFMKHGLMTLATLGLAALVSTGAQAQTAGTIYVDRVGDGSAALSSAGTAIFLDQYSLTGMLGTSLNLTTAGTNTIVNSGSAGSEGGLTQSGNFITFVGYDTAVGTASVTGSTAARGVGIYNIATGKVDTTTALTDAYTANNIRTAATADGTNIFTAGTGTPTSSAGIRSTTIGATTTTQVESSSTNTRYVTVFGGSTYFSTGSTTGVGAIGIYQVTATASTPTKIAADANLSSPYDFVFTNNGSTLYVADSAKGLVKYTLSGGVATYAYSIALANATGLAFGGTDAGGNNILYAVTGAAGSAGDTLVSLDDTGSTATPSLIATASANEAFKGVAFVAGTPAAAPEPSGIVAMLIGMGALGLIVARRRSQQVASSR